ncbi:dynein assembly factor 4, axonemal-like [Pollicipes pollicipes]|uniref:dynein assembly factor 4, axonemal-like n=1 Tax=Pollicipes pollicipes TaxID=41117 RepID=UPI001884CDF8|nr:dynein assembly factor 4, axonemal-like [Pollicipes pollicipes]
MFSVSETTDSEESTTPFCPNPQIPPELSGSASSAPAGPAVAGGSPTPSAHVARSATPAAAPAIPAVRTPGTITFAFTPRSFPSAARESRSQEEQQWLQNQAAAYRRDGALNDEDMRPHERDPRWLKERGDTFYQRGNYLAAINAYSHAIRVSPNAPELFANRAACHLKLNNYHKTLEDSSSALDLLKPPVQVNQTSRLRCHVRRGTALLRLAAFQEALAEYQMALSLDPTNEKLVQDVEMVRKLAEDADSED